MLLSSIMNSLSSNIHTKAQERSVQNPTFISTQRLQSSDFFSSNSLNRTTSVNPLKFGNGVDAVESEAVPFVELILETLEKQLKNGATTAQVDVGKGANSKLNKLVSLTPDTGESGQPIIKIGFIPKDPNRHKLATPKHVTFLMDQSGVVTIFSHSPFYSTMVNGEVIQPRQPIKIHRGEDEIKIPGVVAFKIPADQNPHVVSPD